MLLFGIHVKHYKSIADWFFCSNFSSQIYIWGQYAMGDAYSAAVNQRSSIDLLQATLIRRDLTY